jgi:hypothetical protein
MEACHGRLDYYSCRSRLQLRTLETVSAINKYSYRIALSLALGTCPVSCEWSLDDSNVTVLAPHPVTQSAAIAYSSPQHLI